MKKKAILIDKKTGEQKEVDLFVEHGNEMLKASVWSDSDIQKQIVLAIKWRGWSDSCSQEVKKLADMIREKTGMEYEQYT